MKCELCGRPSLTERMVLVHVAELDDNGVVIFPTRECCPRCITVRAVLMPSRTGRQLAEQMLARMGASPPTQQEFKHEQH